MPNNQFSTSTPRAGIRRLVVLAGTLGFSLASLGLAQERAIPVTQPGSPAASKPGTRANPRAVPPGGKGVQPNAGGRPNIPGVSNVVPGAAPGAEGEKGPEAKHEVPSIEAGDDFVEFSGFAEAVELTSLVEIVAQTLKLNIMSDPNLSGSIVFNAPMKVKRENLLSMLKLMLERNGYTLTYDSAINFYLVGPKSTLEFDPTNAEVVTTIVIETPGIRPSSLKPTIDSQLGAGGSVVGGAAKGAGRSAPQGVPDDGSGMPQPGNPGGGGGAAASSGGGHITYNDELGIIIAVDTTRRLEQIKTLVGKLTEQYQKIETHEIKLSLVAPSVAKQRILEMLGQIAQPSAARNPNRGYEDPNQQPQAPPTAKTNMDNLAERLSASPNGNSLFFRGRDEEFTKVKKIVEFIDSPSNLVPQTYRVGSAAKAIADIARQRGMGEVSTIQAPVTGNNPNNYYYGGGYDPSGGQQRQPQTPIAGGPVMVVDEGRGQIIYYATVELHKQMEQLVTDINPDNDSVVMRDYRLTFAKAEDVSQIVLGLIRNETPSGGNSNSLLPSSTGGNRNGNQPNTVVIQQPVYSNGGELSISGKDSFVIADKANNQVIVKAPLKEQEYFKELISRLDRPVPQVYVEAQIVAVTGSDTFRLAFETQLINADGAGGVFNTNFGLGTQTLITDRKQVRTTLAGGTAALIRSDQVPIVMTAIQTIAETKVLSSPQLLVDANAEESSVESNAEQPTATRSLGTSGSQDTVSFGGYTKAGTKLTIKKPQIGPGNSVRMGVEVELSSFTGDATATLPPPKVTNNVKSQVQVPANMTCVIGGVVVDSKSNSNSKIPLLGDIPILGALFSDQSHTYNKTTLYIFLTPRVLRDEKFGDTRLISNGPMKLVGIKPDIPPLVPGTVEFIDIREPAPTSAPASTPAPANSETPAGGL